MPFQDPRREEGLQAVSRRMPRGSCHAMDRACELAARASTAKPRSALNAVQQIRRPGGFSGLPAMGCDDGFGEKTPAPIPATLGLEERPFRDGCRIVAGNEKNKGHLCMSPPHIRLPHAWMYMRTSNQALCLSVEIPPVRVVSRRVQHQCPDQVCVPPMTFRLGNASFRLGGHPLGDDIGTARN